MKSTCTQPTSNLTPNPPPPLLTFVPTVGRRLVPKPPQHMQSPTMHVMLRRYRPLTVIGPRSPDRA